MRLQKERVVVLNWVKSSILRYFAHVYLVKIGICRLGWPVFVQVFKGPSILFLKLHLGYIFQDRWLFSLFDEINVLEGVFRHQLFADIPELFDALAIVQKGSVTITAIVDVHLVKDVVHEKKRDVSEVHVVEVHYRDILLIMVRNHLEVRHNQEQEVNWVEVFQHFSFCLALFLDRARQFIRPHDQNRMHLFIIAVRINEAQLQPVNSFSGQTGDHFVCMKFLQLHQSLKGLLIVEFSRVKVFQYDLITEILHDRVFVQVSLDVLDCFVLLISVFDFPEDVSFLFAFSHVPENLCFGNDDFHNFGRWSQMFKGVFLKQLGEVVFLYLEEHQF